MIRTKNSKYSFLAGGYTTATGQAIVDQLMDSNFDLGKTLILEEALPPGLELGDQFEGQAEIVSYQANQVAIKTTSSADGLLFLSDNYFPGWHVEVDSQPAKILRANYSFRAVMVPAGTSV